MIRTNRLFPLAPFQLMRGDFDRLLDPLIDLMNEGTPMRRVSVPAVNLWEDGDVLKAEAEVPGLKLEDLEVYADGTELVLKGKWSVETTDKALHRQERASGEFSRTVTLPFEVDSEKVEASLKDGVLKISMPKAAAVRSRKIQVKAT